MRRNYWLIILLQMLTMPMLAQTQQGYVTQEGYVRTIERPNRPSRGVGSVMVKIRDVNRIKSDSTGRFRVVFNDRNKKSFILEDVFKIGYQLKNTGDLREYPYSSSVRFYIDMYSVTEYEAEKRAIYDKIYKDAENNYREKMRILQDQLDDAKYDKTLIEKELEDLRNKIDETPFLLNKVASRLATVDYSKMTEYEKELQSCIENGDLSCVDEIINREGGVDSIYNTAVKWKEINEISSKEIEKAIKTLYASYVSALTRFDFSLAASHIYKVADLDTCNFENQIEASICNRGVGNYDVSLALANRAYNIGKNNLNFKQMGYAWYNIGEYYFSLQDLENAYKSYLKALDYMETEAVPFDDDINEPTIRIGAFNVRDERYSHNDSLLLSSIYLNLSVICSGKGKQNISLAYFGQSSSYKPKLEIGSVEDSKYFFLKMLARGRLLFDKGSWLLAEEHFSSLVKIIDELHINNPISKGFSSIICSYLAAIYSHIKEKHYLAIRFAERSLSEMREAGLAIITEENCVNIYVNSSCAYQANNDNKRAFELIDSARIHYERSFSKSLLTKCTILNNLGQLYYNEDNWDKAINCFKEALFTGYDSKNETSPLVSMLYYNLGQNYKMKNMLDSALFFHNKALEMRLKSTDRREYGLYTLSDSYSSMGNIYYLKKDYIKASQFYEKSYEIKKDIFGCSGKESIVAKKNAFYCLYNKKATDVAIKKYFDEYMKNNSFALVNSSDNIGSDIYYLLEVGDWNINSENDCFVAYENNEGHKNTTLAHSNKIVTINDIDLNSYVITIVPIEKNEKIRLLKLYKKNKRNNSN